MAAFLRVILNLSSPNCFTSMFILVISFSMPAGGDLELFSFPKIGNSTTFVFGGSSHWLYFPSCIAFEIMAHNHFCLSFVVFFLPNFPLSFLLLLLTMLYAVDFSIFCVILFGELREQIGWGNKLRSMYRFLSVFTAQWIIDTWVGLLGLDIYHRITTLSDSIRI